MKTAKSMGLRDHERMVLGVCYAEGIGYGFKDFLKPLLPLQSPLLHQLRRGRHLMNRIKTDRRSLLRRHMDCKSNSDAACLWRTLDRIRYESQGQV